MKKISLALLSFLCLNISNVICQNTNLAIRTPSDALMVFNFNFANIHSKIDLNKIKELEMMKAGFSTIKKQMGRDSSVIKKIYEDPNSYGINLKPSLAIVLRKLENELGEANINSLFIINLSNAKKFEKLLKVFFDEGTEYKDFLETKGAFKIFQSNNMAFAWNSNTAYLIPISYSNRETIDEEINTLLKLNKDNSLINNPTFSEKSIGSNDINFWMDYEKFLEMAEENSQSLNKKIFELNYDRLKGTETEIGVSFNNGKIVFDALSKVTEVLKKDNAAIYSKRINPEFFNYLREDSLIGVYSMAFNIEELKKSVELNYKNLLDTLEKAVQREFLRRAADSNTVVLEFQKKLDSDTLEWSDRWPIQDSLDNAIDSIINLGMKSIDKKIDKTLNEFGLTKQDAWKLFTGDFLIASTGIYNVVDTITTMEYAENLDGEMDYIEVEKTELSPRPLFVAMASVNLEDKCAFALKKLESNGLIKKQNDYYYVTVTKYDLFIKLNGNVLILTNDKELVTKQHKKGHNIYGKPLNGDLLKKSSNSPMYTYINIEKILTLIPTKEEFAKKIKEPALNTFDSFEAHSTLQNDHNLSSKATLQFKKEDNSIHILFNLANEYFKIFTNM